MNDSGVTLFPPLTHALRADFAPLVDILQERLPRRARRMVGLVSGGPDSTALAVALALAREDSSWGRVELVHFDHQLRPESGEEARFVEALGVWLGVSVRVETLPVRKHAHETGLGIEGAARELRLVWLRNHLGLGEFAADAHHRDDQAESVALQLIRGAGPLGAAGIQPCLEGMLFRPWLGVEKEAIRRVLQRASIPYREDPSNRELTYLRNRLRWQVLRDRTELVKRLIELGVRSSKLRPLAWGWWQGGKAHAPRCPGGERGMIEAALLRSLPLVRFSPEVRRLWQRTLGREMGIRLAVYLTARGFGVGLSRGEVEEFARAVGERKDYQTQRFFLLWRPGALVMGRPLSEEPAVFSLVDWRERFGVGVEVEGVDPGKLRVLNRAAWRKDPRVGHLYRKKLLQSVAPRELRGVWPILVWPEKGVYQVLGTGRWLGEGREGIPRVRFSLLNQGEEQLG